MDTADLSGGRSSGRDHQHGHDGIWMVSAWPNENRIVLRHTKINDKSNEITAIPRLLVQLDLSGCVVTVDALNMQIAIAQPIVSANVDYIMIIKGNHRTLYEDLQVLFDWFAEGFYCEVSDKTEK